MEEIDLMMDTQNTKRAIKALQTFAALCGVIALINPIAARAQSPAPAALAPAAPSPAQIEAVQADDTSWSNRFGVPGIPDSSIESIAVAANGDAYVAGGFEIPSVGAKSIARWDGNRWYALGTGLSSFTDRIYEVATAGNFVYAGGSFKEIGGVSANGIAVWDGTAWNPLGTGTGVLKRDQYGAQDGRVNAVAVAPNGNVYIAGDFNEVDEVPAFGIARWDGTKWNALGAGIAVAGFEEGTKMAGHGYAITIVNNTSIYVGGEFAFAGDVDAYSIARWNGTTWSALGSGITTDSTYITPGVVRAIAVNPAGEVYAGGAFQKAGGVNVANIAKWNGTAWSALGVGVAIQYESEPPISALIMDGTTLIAGGTFNRAGNVANTVGIARWNGTAWSAMPQALTDPNDVNVKTLALSAAGKFYAGGQINAAGSAEDAEKQFLFGIGLWTGEHWASLGGGVSSYNTDPADVLATAQDDKGNLYVGGKINRAGGLKVNHVAMFDGTEWHDMAGGVSGGALLVYAILPIGDDIYVAGDFTQAGNVAASNIAKWNRVTNQWSPLGAGADGTVYALTFGDGILFAGGAFDQAGGVTARDLAMWNGTAWTALGGNYEIYEIFDTGAEAGTFVEALTYVNGQLIAGGHFQTVHDKAKPFSDKTSYTVVHNLIAYTVANQSWGALGSLAAPGVNNGGFSGFGTDVYALTHIGNAVYVGGTFNRAGDTPVQNIARYDLAAGAWSAVGNTGGVESVNVRALAAYGTNLYIGGAFTTIGTVNARFAARLDTANNTWFTLGSGMKWYNDKYTQVKAVSVSDQGVFFGGQFDKAGNLPSIGVAFWSDVQAGGNLTPEQGGVVNGDDGTRIEVPAGAVNQPANLVYTQLPLGNTTPPANQNVVRRLQVTTQALNGQPINTLAKPMTLKLSYTDAQLQAAKIDGANTLAVVQWNGTAWQPVAGSTVDTANKVVTVQTTAMGTYAILGKAQGSVTPPPPPGNLKLLMPMLSK